MRKRKWYERMSAAALIAVLLVNHGDMGIMAKAETIPALEESLKTKDHNTDPETASASNAAEKRDTAESAPEAETATASNGKETLEIKRKMAKSVMNADPVTEGTYSISQPTEGTFQVRGGSLGDDGMSAKDLTDAIDKILENRRIRK